MAFGLYFREDTGQLAVWSNEKSRTLNAPHLLAIHIFVLHHAKLIADCFVYICKERVGQIVLLFEFLLRLRCVARDAQDYDAGLLQLFEGVAKPAGFNGAARRVGAWIEEEHN